MNEGRKEYTLKWFIEDYSYWDNGGDLWSPTFHTDGLEGTDWVLAIYPRGRTADASGYVSIGLCRWDDENVPENVPLTFQFSLLAADGSAHHSAELKHTFGIRGGYYDDRLMTIDDLQVRRRADYLPKDTLTVCCKMWTGEGDVLRAGRISARTRPTTEKLSFSPVVEKFSKLKPDEKRTIKIRSHLKKSCVLSFRLCLVRDTYGKEQIIIENVLVDPVNWDYKYKFQFFLEGTNSDLLNYGETAVGKNDLKLLTPSLTKQDILKYGRLLLPDDTLSLVCECTIFTRLESRKIEEIIHDLPLDASNQKGKASGSKSVDKASEMMQNEHPGALEDMKALYNEQCLTDVQLKTKTKSFPAHKLVLCARSPVFKSMLTRDMKEKTKNCIQVDDLEDDIVQQLLLFLYSDCLEQPLQWRSATRLYYAADKYAVRKLQAMCSKFLADNLTPSNATELLLLADLHSDTNLMAIVEDFILENEEQVFGSKEWDKLVETNPQLVIKTMHLKYKKKESELIQ